MREKNQKERRAIAHAGGKRPRHRSIVAGLFSVTLLVSVTQTPASAVVPSVSGGAFGWKTAVSLFGGPTNVRGTDAADAIVVLPSSGSAVPIVDQALSGTGQYGPAVIFRSGPVVVSTQGEKGDALRPASVSSSSSVTDVGTWTGVTVEDETGVWEPALGGHMDPFIALEVSSTCTTTENGQASGTTTIVGGRLVDTDANGDPTNERQVAVNPAPNGPPESGTLAHVGDNWEVYFNEQEISADGKSITVNAVHLKLLGPTAVGDMYIGQSRCGFPA